ncbi:MAG: transcriptional regulator NrdR [Candidatus Neomarinimicrobiota bacterium]
MRCPYCDFDDSKVIDSRDVDDVIRRRRQCLRCSLRFTTLERIQATAIYVIKRDGRREEFNRGKLASGLRKACAKRALPTGTIEKVVDDIEGELHKLGKVEIPSGIIGEMVINYLRKLDRVAYIRFASVYRDFADVETFKEEVDSLLQSGKAVEEPPSAQLPLMLEEDGIPVRRRRRRRKTKAL